MKKVFKEIAIITFILMQLFLLCGCDKEESNEKLNEKVEQEISYFDNQIISMLNAINSIYMENYDVEVKEVQLDNQNSSSSQSGGGSEQNSQSGGSSEQGGESGQSSSSGQENKSTIVASEMKPNNVLVTSRDKADWVTLKSNIELIYSSWNTTILDLYKLNVNADNILGFSKTLDITTVAIKNEDKTKSLTNLASLYSYLTKYQDEISKNNGQKNLYNVKSNILTAYSIAEQENWDEIANQLAQAEKSFINIMNDIEYIKGKEFVANKVYIELKELQNCIIEKDKDIFYIKYRNLIEDIQNL